MFNLYTRQTISLGAMSTLQETALMAIKNW